jgi:hypothetical protein
VIKYTGEFLPHQKKFVKKSVFLYLEDEDGKNIDFYSNFFKTNLFIG